MTIIPSNKPLEKRREADYYPTPYRLCEQAIKICIPPYVGPTYVLDAGCGDGVWGKAARARWPNSIIAGVDIREVEKQPEYDFLFIQDFLDLDTPNWDIIIGNPPYSHKEEFLDRSLAMVVTGGYVLFLFRTAFLESKKRYDKYYNNNLNPIQVWQSVSRISFYGNNGSDDNAYALYLWKKGWTGNTTLHWLDWKNG